MSCFTNLYGNRYRSRWICSNTCLNSVMTCSAIMSWRTSSPTLKMHDIRSGDPITENNVQYGGGVYKQQTKISEFFLDLGFFQLSDL